MNAPRRRLLRSALLTVLLLGFGGAAVGSAVMVMRGLDPAPEPTGTAARETGGTDEDDAPSKAETRRERVRVAPVAPPAGPDGTQTTGEAAVAEPEAPVGFSGAIIPVSATPSGTPLRVFDNEFHIELASEPAMVFEAVVEPGRQPDLALAWFVEAGAGTPTEPSELVGERDPVLEDGVPVALSGRVVDLADGQPIAGAAVLVTSTFYVRQVQYDHHLREVARVRTDAKGEYEIRRLNADPVHFGKGGRVLVTVRADGFAPAEAIPLENVRPGDEAFLPDVVLSGETHVLRGRVTDHWENLPVAGARVIATGATNPISYPKDQRDALFLGAPDTVTDADGHFELTGLGPGPQWISVHHGDDCVGREQFDVPKQNDVAIRSHPARGRITGRVVDAYDEPVPLAIVYGGANNTHSFADGSFVLENFRGDVLDLAVSHPDFQSLRVSDIADGVEDVLVRLIHRQPRIRLAVRDADTGEPIRHIEIGVFIDDGNSLTPVTATASPHYLDEHGVHEIVLPTGIASLTLIVNATGHEPMSLDATTLRDGDQHSVALPRTE